MRITTKSILGIQLLSLISLCSFFLNVNLVSAASIDSILGNAHAFNAYVFSSFNANNSKVGGAVAVGGNIKINNYSIATDENFDKLAYSLLVEGNASYNNGRVNTGKVRIAGDISNRTDPALKSIPIGESLENKPLDFSIRNSKLFYQTLSITLSALPANGSVEKRGQGLYLRGDCTSALQVFNVEGRSIKGSHTFDVHCIPDNATVIFNMSSNIIPFENNDMSSLEKHRSRVLFNFYKAKKVELSSVKFEGSILAPNARVIGNEGDLMGTVIAKSWRGSMHLGYVPFIGKLNEAEEDSHISVPEESIEEVVEVNIEKIAEVNVEEISDVNTEEVTEVNIEKIAEVNLEKIVEVNIEKIAEVNVEEISDVNIEKVTEVNIEKVAEVHIEKIVEVNIEEIAEVQAEEVVEVKAEKVAEVNLEKIVEVNIEKVTEVNIEKVAEVNTEKVAEVHIEKIVEVNIEEIAEVQAEEVVEVKAEEIVEVKAEEVVEAKTEEKVANTNNDISLPLKGSDS